MCITNFWTNGSKGLSLCLGLAIWMMPLADVSFGATVEISDKAADGSLVFSEGTVLVPLLLASQVNPGTIADGRNHVAMGFGGNLYDPGEPFGSVFGHVQLPISTIPAPLFSLSRRPSPSWLGAPPLKPLADLSGLTSGQGIIGSSSGSAGLITLTGTIPTTSSVGLTLRGFVGTTQVATTPLPGAVWLFLSGMGLIGVVRRFRAG